MESLQLYLLVGSTVVFAAFVAYSRANRRSGALKKSDDADNADEPDVATLRSLSPRLHSTLELPRHKTETHQKIMDIWAKPIDKTAVFIDLPRLAKRMDIYVDNIALFANNDDMEPMAAVAGCIKSVAKHFENDAQYAAIAAQCEQIATSSKDGLPAHVQPAVLLKDLFVNVIGLDSSTTSVFRCVHQGLVMPLSFALKAYTRLLCKDLKTRDGWRVRVDLSSDANARFGAIVTHIRREVSFGSAENDSFFVELRTALFVDGASKQLDSADTNIICNQPQNPALHSAFAGEFARIGGWNSA